MMAVSVDWVAECAARIYLENQRSLKGDRPSFQRIARLIREHCPFKQDTAYVEMRYCGKDQPSPCIHEDD